MNEIIRKLLAGQEENHMLPFFWQHGEDEATLRAYMEAIEGANCRAVCVESRPHPDFCGAKWWQDMDVILDEARKRGMKVWILDDSHFPTGAANGAVKSAPPELHRQSVCVNRIALDGEAREAELCLEGLIPPAFTPKSRIEEYILPDVLKDAPHFEDDRVIALTAVGAGGETVFIPYHGEKRVRWRKPAGKWTVHAVGLSRNCGPHREYINMLEPESVRLLIDAVYEKHWQHYAADFGKTIAGFFSDEPELGNGHLYFFDNQLGTDQDLPFGYTLPERLEERLGADWANRLYLLWEEGADPAETAEVREAYMDAVTRLVRESFSRQIGDWCRAHGVRYIGHMIEDSNAHARTGSSLGHYFRGLDGQDMAGIDDIGGQVLPGGEDEPRMGRIMPRDGEFYHFMLGNLAASAAAIEPAKRGNAMCEIFGNYGWEEGVRLEKYLADHFMVRGINHFVPHAFSPAPFPDPDCPPHFYAHGHNPQYRHFGCLMAYMNRVCTLISGGHPVSRTAVIYHAEAEWMGGAMLTQKPVRKLMEAQIACDTIPWDVFAEKEHYRTAVGNPLTVNGQEYRALVVPGARRLPEGAMRALAELQEAGLPVLFAEEKPEGAKGRTVSLEKLADELRALGVPELCLNPADRAVRVLHYAGRAELFLMVNEGSSPWEGTVSLPAEEGYFYDAWENRAWPARISGGTLKLRLEPLKSVILVVGKPDAPLSGTPAMPEGEKTEIREWQRSVCESIRYPAFGEAVPVSLPDRLAEERPEFSGFVRYEATVRIPEGRRAVLEITDAAEGVELFVNGESAGIQIAPPFRYEITKLVRGEETRLAVEVATTLERAMYARQKDDPMARMRGLREPACGSGLTGTVNLWTTDGAQNDEDF